MKFNLLKWLKIHLIDPLNIKKIKQDISVLEKKDELLQRLSYEYLNSDKSLCEIIYEFSGSSRATPIYYVKDEFLINQIKNKQEPII